MTDTTLTIPDAKTVVIRLNLTRLHVLGAREVTDPETGKKSFEAVERPVKNAGQPTEAVYLLIKPDILIQVDYEAPGSSEDGNTLGSARGRDGAAETGSR